MTVQNIEEQLLSEIAELHPSKGITRLELECDHQHGLVYVVDGAEMNWVCSNRRRPAHSFSGFFNELVEMKDPRIKELMNRWGLYYRPLPLAEQAAQAEEKEGDAPTA